MIGEGAFDSITPLLDLYFVIASLIFFLLMTREDLRREFIAWTMTRLHQVEHIST